MLNLITHLCGAGLGFLGFSASLIIGLYVNNSFVEVILRALFVLLAFYILGYILALLGLKIIQENFENEIKSSQNETDSDSQPISQSTENSPHTEQPVTT